MQLSHLQTENESTQHSPRLQPSPRLHLINNNRLDPRHIREANNTTNSVAVSTQEKHRTSGPFKGDTTDSLANSITNFSKSNNEETAGTYTSRNLHRTRDTKPNFMRKKSKKKSRALPSLFNDSKASPRDYQFQFSVDVASVPGGLSRKRADDDGSAGVFNSTFDEGFGTALDTTDTHSAKYPRRGGIEKNYFKNKAKMRKQSHQESFLHRSS